MPDDHRITIRRQPIIRNAARIYPHYEAAFREISELAVQQHLMTPAQFDAVLADRRVFKFTATTPVGAFLGQSVITNQLDAWPTISAGYFRRHYPHLFNAQSIWYIGYVFTAAEPVRASAHLFRQLIGAMYPLVINSGGMAVMDFCTWNVANRHIDRATQHILTALNPGARGLQLDAQEFWAWTFPETVLNGARQTATSGAG